MPFLSLTMSRKWFWSAEFWKVSSPLLGIDFGFLLHFVLSTAFTLALAGMTLPVSRPATVKGVNASALLVLMSTAQ